jgi:hypothetical protein
LKHSKDLVWDSVKSIMLLSTTCSTTLPPAIGVSPSSSPVVLSVLGNPDIVREYIVPYLKRKDIISIDPELRGQGADDLVKRRIEASLGAGFCHGCRTAAAF